jgi:hypothetical protein
MVTEVEADRSVLRSLAEAWGQDRVH